jgi:DNA-binding protein H-NS
MAKTYAQIQDEIAALQQRANAARSKEKVEVVGQMKAAIAVYGITAQDLGLSRGTEASPVRKTARRARKAAEAKYRDDAGNIWGGRGPHPKWLRDALDAGKVLKDFAV